MKPGIYVVKTTDEIFVVSANESVIGIGDGWDYDYSLSTLSAAGVRPATKQDIIDILLPLIPEIKEPGQVAFEAAYQSSRIGGPLTKWHDGEVDENSSSLDCCRTRRTGGLSEMTLTDVIIVLGIAFIFIWPKVVGKIIERDINRKEKCQ